MTPDVQNPGSVLNALRHRGEVNNRPGGVVVHAGGCSTPYGIEAR